MVNKLHSWICVCGKTYTTKGVANILGPGSAAGVVRVSTYVPSAYRFPYIRGVKLAARGSNPARHDPFCCPRHVTFVLALGLTEYFYVVGESRFLFESHNATLRLNNWAEPRVGNLRLRCRSRLFSASEVALSGFDKIWNLNLFFNMVTIRIE